MQKQSKFVEILIKQSQSLHELKNKEGIGIYQIKNVENGKKYIGSSIHIQDRWNQHIQLLRSNRHCNYLLQNDWLNYGENSFEFSIIINLKSDINLLRIEFEYIKKEPLENLYNIIVTNTTTPFRNDWFTKLQINVIPRLEFSRYLTWVPATDCCIAAYELYKNPSINSKKLAMSYFDNKKIIISSIMVDESEITYINYLERINLEDNRLILMTPDCATYDDWDDEWQKEEYVFWKEQLLAFKTFITDKNLPLIAILKGRNEKELLDSYMLLKELFHPQAYMLYISGYIRSNPAHFSVWNFLQEKLPIFTEPLFLYGFNKKSVSKLPLIKKTYNIQGIISSSYILDAKYRNNTQYKFHTRAHRAWKSYQRLFI